jgi:hypothetical protein
MVKPIHLNDISLALRPQRRVIAVQQRLRYFAPPIGAAGKNL